MGLLGKVAAVKAVKGRKEDKKDAKEEAKKEESNYLNYTRVYSGIFFFVIVSYSLIPGEGSAGKIAWLNRSDVIY